MTPSSVTWYGRLAPILNPLTIIIAIGAGWTSTMAAGGSSAMSVIAGWLWLTALFTARRAVTRKRTPRPMP